MEVKVGKTMDSASYKLKVFTTVGNVPVEQNIANNRAPVQPPVHENYFFFAGDVSVESQVQLGMQAIQKRWGSLHAAFNAAGVCPPLAATADVTWKDWRATLDTNFKGTWLCLKHQLPRMDPSASPAIVNFSSMLSQVGAEELAPYIASKAALLELTRAASRETLGIRVNVLCPGLVFSLMVERVLTPSQHAALLFNASPMSEVVSTALRLASPAAGGINGQALEVGRDVRRV